MKHFKIGFSIIGVFFGINSMAAFFEFSKNKETAAKIEKHENVQIIKSTKCHEKFEHALAIVEGNGNLLCLTKNPAEDSNAEEMIHQALGSNDYFEIRNAQVLVDRVKNEATLEKFQGVDLKYFDNNLKKNE